ncbi:MAG: SurA N-terminal domain-containing protein, partial [Acidobacteriota bacterium]|nr:SurA N-terminal domain-containing protein [Acidobacteriota bacterium]
MERTRNFVLLVFAIIMVVSLIVFYAPTRGDVAGNLTRNEETVAKVGGEQVTIADVALQQETMSRNGRPAPSKTLLNQIIGQRLVRIEANRLGLGTSDAEVASFIRQQFKTP